MKNERKGEKLTLLVNAISELGKETKTEKMIYQEVKRLTIASSMYGIYVLYENDFIRFQKELYKTDKEFVFILMFYHMQIYGVIQKRKSELGEKYEQVLSAYSKMEFAIFEFLRTSSVRNWKRHTQNVVVLQQWIQKNSSRIQSLKSDSLKATYHCITMEDGQICYYDVIRKKRITILENSDRAAYAIMCFLESVYLETQMQCQNCSVTEQGNMMRLLKSFVLCIVSFFFDEPC